MLKKIIKISLAYVAILTRAGLASGQEILQYFVAYGNQGLISAVIVLLLHTFIGAIVLELGSYYLADEHSDVLNEIASPIFTKIFDYILIITCFVIGFVMISGAGSNLNQQFGLEIWQGSLICTLLVIFVGMLDFDKVTKIIGAFTPFIVALIFIASIYTIMNFDGDFSKVAAISQTIPKNFSNPWISVINYFSMCMMVGISTAFAIGGDNLVTRHANLGGLVGGLLVGLITSLLALVLYIQVDTVKTSDLPTQLLVSKIHPVLGFIMSLIIFGMIFNTAIGLYYALAKRFSKNDDKKYKIYLISFCIIGFALSFLGFKTLISIMYPIIGYVGIFLIAFLVFSYVKNYKKIKKEGHRRFSIMKLATKKYDESLDFTRKDKEKINKLIENSNIENDILKTEVKERIQEKLDN